MPNLTEPGWQELQFHHYLKSSSAMVLVAVNPHVLQNILSNTILRFGWIEREILIKVFYKPLNRLNELLTSLLRTFKLSPQAEKAKYELSHEMRMNVAFVLICVLFVLII